MSNVLDARSAARALLALVMVALVAAGCGVPGSSDPEAVEDAPGLGGPAAPAENVELPKPSRNLQAPDLVRNFLKVGAAADWSADLDKDERIKYAGEYARQQFFSPEATWTPAASIEVIQVISVMQVEIDTVAVKFRRVGVLDGDGTLTPNLDAPAEEDATFQITQSGDNGPLLLKSAPPNLLPLSLDGLQTLFEVRPVYYWEPNYRFLVPDRRYLSKGISPDKRVKAIVERVLAGPSNLLTSAVPDPPVSAPVDNTQLNGNKVEVNLPVSEQTDRPEVLERLASQIRWSLHPNRYTVELRVGGREGRTYSGSDYEDDNPAQTRSTRSNDQRRYAAVDGVVKRLTDGDTSPSILSRPENTGVVAAAVNTMNNSAALVRWVGGQFQLWVGRTPTDQSAPRFRQVTFTAPITSYSRPSYLSGAVDRVLIVVNGVLYDVDLGSGESLPVQLPPIVGAPVAVSVAPDGVRVAIVTEADRAYVATLDARKRPAAFNSSASTAQPVQEVYIGGLADLKGVGWFYEDQIAVGGRSGIMVAAIDGGALEQVAPGNLLNLQLTQLSAVPGNPIGGEGGNIVFEANGSGSGLAGYVPYRTEITALPPPSSSSGASASPSASGAGAPPKPKVTAPFYADVI